MPEFGGKVDKNRFGSLRVQTRWRAVTKIFIMSSDDERRSEARCPDISDISRYRPIWADIWRSLTIGLDRLKEGHGPLLEQKGCPKLQKHFSAIFHMYFLFWL